MYRRSSLLVLASVLVAVGCDDVRNPAGPSTEAPSAMISDGRFARVGDNDDFFFLPPLMPDPSKALTYDAGGFNAALGPTVSVCELTGDPTNVPPSAPPPDCRLVGGNPVLVASFTSSQVQVSTSSQHYGVNWNTGLSNLGLSKFYRLQVFLGSTRIGFADIDPVTSRELKNPATGEAIPLLDGRTLPIKFRIENGVLCEKKSDCGEFKVTNTGGTFTTNTKDAAIQFKSGFLPTGVSEITVTIERKTVGSDNNCHGEAGSQLWKQFEGCYEIKSDPDLEPYGGIQQVAIAAQCVEVSPTDPLFHFLAPYKSHNGKLERLRNTAQTFLDCEGFSGSTASVPSSNPLIRYASSGLRQLGNGLGRVFGVRTAEAIDLGLGEELPIGSALSRFNWAIGIEPDVSGGTEQSAGFGLPAAQPLEVHVTTRHFHAGEVDEGDGHAQDIGGVAVVFTVDEGDGYFELDEEGIPVREKTALSNADGRASVSFTAASNDAANVVVASVPRLDLDEEGPPPPLTFSIAGLPSDLTVENLTRSIASPTSVDALSWSFDVTNIGQGVAIASTVRLVVTFEGEGTETVASYDLPVPKLNPGASVTLLTPVLAAPRDVGDHSVMVMANATSTVVEADDENNTDSQDFVVVPAIFNIIGHVADNGTSPRFLPGAVIALVELERTDIANDVTGSLRFAAVPPGTYTLRVTNPGYVPLQRTVVVPGDGTVESDALTEGGPSDVVADFRMVLETNPSQLSMQTGATWQLGVPSARTVTWSGSNSNATVSATGLVTVLRGGEINGSSAAEAIFTATAANGATGRAKVNSFAFDRFPRELTLVWSPVNTAVSYLVEWQYGNGSGTGAECGGVPENCTTWTADGSAVVTGTSHMISFVGRQPGRWRITATLASGAVLAPSLWVWFDFDV